MLSPVPSSQESEVLTLGFNEPGSGTPSSARSTRGDGPCLVAGSPASPSTTTCADSRPTHPTLDCSAEGSPARTCPSPDNDAASRESTPPSSTSSHESLTLFDLDGFSSRTYPDCSPHTAVGTSESCLARWPTSGTAWRGGLSTHVSSECRSTDGVCSSSEPTLVEILEPLRNVPRKYWLSARAASGILLRAGDRGRTMRSRLSAALEAVARTTTTDRRDG